MIIEFEGKTPRVDEAAFIAPNATIAGDVTLGKDSSVWYGAVLRADFASIEVGARSNVQENAVLHVDFGKPIVIGENVTIGHIANVHGATIGDYALIGMGATVLNGAVIGEGAIVAAGALVKENAVVEPYTLVAGVPAVPKKKLDPQARREDDNAEVYVNISRTFAQASCIG